MNRHTNDANTSRQRRPMAFADWFGIACLILFGACSLILLIRLLTTKMLTSSLVTAVVIALAVLNGLHFFVQLPRWKHLWPKIVCGIVALLLSGAMIYVSVAAGGVQSVLQNISGKLVEKETTYVIVRKDDPARDIGDTQDYRFGSLSHADKKNTEALLQAVKDGLGRLNNTSYESILDLADALYSNKVDAIMLNEGYIAMLEGMDGYHDFSQRTRILYEFTTEHEVQPISPNSAITREPFVVYCSGIDARSTDMNIKSLSDGNILAVIHPITRQILLINTPRDYYVPLVSEPFTGRLDKLTHAGGLGIKESMKVLGNLYGVDPTYYMRINFQGLVDVVDALDGIDVNSPQAFTTTYIGVLENGDECKYTFKKGPNHLNGHQALAYSRERQAFEGGDNQRGQNQMAVISGIVDKATSREILTRYDELFKAVEHCFITNMPYQDITSLVKMQLRDMSKWNITAYSVTGTADMQPCATIGTQDLWVMWPDKEGVETAKNLIQQVMNGQAPVVPEKTN